MKIQQRIRLESGLMALLVFPIHLTAQTGIDFGLIGHYQFDGNALDSSGKAHNAVTSGALYSSDRFGSTNGALDLRGANNWASIAHHSDFQFGTNDFSFALWLKYGAQSSYSTALIKASLSLPYSGPTLFLDIQPGKATYRITAPNEGRSVASGLNDNVWRHFVFVRTGTTLRLYINGVLDSTNNTSPMLDLATTQPLWLGCNHMDPAYQNFDGLMDDLRIYNRSLSEQDIQAIFQTGLIRQQPASFVGREGTGGTFQVVASGALPITCQWFKNGLIMPGETNAVLTFASLDFSDEGTYTVAVTNDFGMEVSSPATLTVSPDVAVSLYAGLEFRGVIGRTYAIQETTDLSDTNSWQTITNLMLQTSPQLWIDTEKAAQPGSQPRRFYRVTVVP